MIEVTPEKIAKERQEWQENKMKIKNQRLSDDGTQSFFWRAHTVTVLVVMIVVLVYVALIEEQVQDQSYNIKRGLIACASFFVLFGVIQTPDGPFIRPHPALWRLVLMLSVLYEIALIYILFQTVDDARQLLTHLDPNLGQPLPEKDYGGNCLIYDPSNVEDPFHNFWDKMDGFVTTHFFGWWLKTLIIRDYWLCNVMSIGFELLEYSLQHQLPNFSECWWDHWLLDVVICNGLGIYLGMKTCEYFTMKPYYWRGLWNIPTISGKLKRIVGQFSPYNWIPYDWRPTSSLKRWLYMLLLMTFFFTAELGTFYLKYILWIPPPHFLCLGRLVFMWLVGAVAMRETFEFMDNPYCKRMGTQTWLCIAIIVTEVLIVLKFDWDTVTKPFPSDIALYWKIFAGGLIVWTVYQFIVKPIYHSLRHSEDKKSC